jgi:hypothetical protein
MVVCVMTVLRMGSPGPGRKGRRDQDLGDNEACRRYLKAGGDGSRMPMRVEDTPANAAASMPHWMATPSLDDPRERWA